VRGGKPTRALKGLHPFSSKVENNLPWPNLS
jgi:hypothetical protein